MLGLAENYWVYLLTACIIAAGCGSSSHKIEQKPELDTLNYYQFIANEPDSSVYPILQQVSSQRDPITDFGLQKMFDGDMATSWQSEPGLHAGEWVSFQFESLPVSRIAIHVSDTFLVARVNQIEVWINDTLMGQFPAKSTITYNGKLKKILIRAMDADGFNLVDIPPIQDTTQLERIAYRQLGSYYNSKSFAISEIVFFDELGKKIPLQPIPYRMAKINTWDFTPPSDIADGNLTTGWSNFHLNEHRINIAFDEFTPITKVKLFNGIERNTKIKGIQKCILSLPGRPDSQWTLKPGWNEYKLPLPMVGKMFTLRMIATQPMGLAELLFYDGARYYQPYSDSLHTQIQYVKDILAKTPLHPALNNRLYFKERIVVLKSDTVSNKNYKDLPISQLQGTRTSTYDLILRANQSIELKSELMKEIYGREIRIILENKSLIGRWMIKSIDDNGEVLLQVKGILKITRTESGNTNQFIQENYSALFKASSKLLYMDDWGEMLISY